MAFFEPITTYTYDDIGLVPTKLSTVSSRKNVDTSTEFLGLQLSMPIVVAPMATVVGPTMAIKIRGLGGLACLPRTNNEDNDLRNFKEVRLVIEDEVIVSVGLNDFNLFGDYLKLGATRFCIDVANGFHQNVADFIQKINAFYDLDNIHVITGNVASIEGYKFLDDIGVSAIRCGIGGGGACSTSMATSVSGTGQATLINEIADYNYNYIKNDTAYVIADGGIKRPGHLALAIALGADVVMMGSVFAGTTEAAGYLDDNGMKTFAGQASAQIKGHNNFIEGAEFKIPHKGSVEKVWKEYEDGLRSAMAYMNCHTIEQFTYLDDENFTLWSPAVKKERMPHAGK